MIDGHEAPERFPLHGEVAGYIVLTRTPIGSWADDWDGEVHPTLDAGRASLRECSQAGWTCILTEAKRVAGSPSIEESEHSCSVCGPYTETPAEHVERNHWIDHD